jgi:hypothetical protein
VVWVDEAAPHVRDRAVVVAEPFFWLLEIPADKVNKRINRHLGVGVEAVLVV